MSEEEITIEELELETLEVETMLVEAEVKPEKKLPAMTPERIASHELAHDIKVAKFLSGGKY